VLARHYLDALSSEFVADCLAVKIALHFSLFDLLNVVTSLQGDE